MRKKAKTEIHGIAGDVRRMSERFTRDREALQPGYLADAAARRAYEAYYVPVNAAKVDALLAHLANLDKSLLSGERVRILDLGSGPGSALLGTLSFFSRRKIKPEIECTAVDHVSENLPLAESTVRRASAAFGLSTQVRTVCCPVTEALKNSRGQFDLIVLANVLNELFPGTKARTAQCSVLLGEFANTLTESGVCVVIEPALRETSRDLLRVRDELLSQGLSLCGPCPGSGPCPALDNPKDWCHEDAAWDPPKSVEEIDDLIGLRKDSLKFSWIAFRKKSHAVQPDAGRFRVVSEPMVSKGKREYFICNGFSRKRAVRLDKDSDPANAAFSSLLRGDIVSFTALLEEKERYKITRSTSVLLLGGLARQTR
jgi:ribosomal protein RSM22 (predicted rRNA methylase)